MIQLLIVNSKSNTTLSFWNRHQNQILGFFNETEIIETLTAISQYSDFKTIKKIIVIGNDAFFTDVINRFYEVIEKKGPLPPFGLIADSKESLLAYDMCLPFKMQPRLELLAKNHFVPLDLIRCHYVGKDNAPCNRFILNDAIIGIQPLKTPLVESSITNKFRFWLSGLLQPKRKMIRICESNEETYSGDYVFSIILLGNQITGGPRIRSKIRLNLNHFEYFQFSPHSLPQLWYSMIKLRQGHFFSLGAPIFQGQFCDQKLLATGEENSIIADGQYLGHLPATFTFLPKAIRVISSISSIPVSETVTNEVITPQPLLSRTSL